MNQSAWSKAHIAAYFPPVQTQTSRQTWLTRVLKWLCKGHEIIFVRPDGAITRCRTPDQFLDLSQTWRRPEGQSVYHFSKRSCIHIVAAQTGAVSSGKQEQNNRAGILKGETLVNLKKMVTRAEKRATEESGKARQ